MRKNLDQPIHRSQYILGILLALVLVTGGIFLLVGTNTGELQSKLIQPTQQTWNGMIKMLADAFTSDSKKQRKGYDVTVTSTSESKINVIINNNYKGSTPSATKYPTYSPQYTYPTKSYPTPAPGEPGSKEWYEKNKVFSESVSERMKQFCVKNPSASVCN